jgi:DNA-binding transcriptional MerR regulator
MHGGDGADEADQAARYSLEELAEASAVPARTIRFYRQSGLVAAPRREGRRAFYDADHLERLRTIVELREGGFGLDAIATILEDPDGARAALPRVLQISDELRMPWIDDREAVLTELELMEVLGTPRAGVVDLLTKWEIATPTASSSPQTYHVPSVATLELMGELLGAGIHEELAYVSYQAIRRHLAALAQELLAVYSSARAAALATQFTLDELGLAFRQLRPIARQAVQIVFAHEIEKVVAEFVAQGGLLDIRPSDAE